MVSTEQKQRNERLRTRRIISAAFGVSLLLHGALWAVARQTPMLDSTSETLFEVTLSPQAMPTPKAKTIPAATPAPLRMVRVQSRLKIEHQHPRSAVTKSQFPKSPRRARWSTLPRALNQAAKAQGFVAAAKAPLRKSAPHPPTSASLNLLRSSASTPRNTNNTFPNLGSRVSRPDERNPLAATTSVRSASVTELANLPQGNAFPESGSESQGNRSGRRRSGSTFGDTQVYLADTGSPGSSLPNGESSAITMRPHLTSGTGAGRSDNSRFSSGNRLARGSGKGALPVARPTNEPRPSARSEEANDTVTNGNQSRRPRMAHRQSRPDETLYPTPTPPPGLKPEIRPDQKPEPERELFHPAKVRSAPKPAYPADAKANDQEGTVVVRLQISQTGRVTDSSIVSSSGVASLDKASRQGVLRWTYEPARRGKTAVASSKIVPLRWRLTD